MPVDSGRWRAFGRPQRARRIGLGAERPRSEFSILGQILSRCSTHRLGGRTTGPSRPRNRHPAVARPSRAPCRRKKLLGPRRRLCARSTGRHHGCHAQRRPGGRKVDHFQRIGVTCQSLTGTVRLVGAAGIEPANAGTKNRCLTTWLRPIRGALAGAAIMPANCRYPQAFT